MGEMFCSLIAQSRQCAGTNYNCARASKFTTEREMGYAAYGFTGTVLDYKESYLLP